jgi:GNAT superfamily N-acetyltransferase
VLLDIRRIKNRRMFVSAARAAARTRPVFAIRAGGRLQDASGLADAVMEAALRRAGVLRVAGLEDLPSAAEMLARIGPSPRMSGPGERVALVTNGVGLGALAADALIAGGGRLAELDEAALPALAVHPAGVRSLLAIPPYPAELARPWRSRDGRELLVRPIRPGDAAAHAEAFRRLSPEDVRLRFFSALSELRAAQIARMTQIDYDREMAFVAVERNAAGPDRTVGVSRLIRAPGGEEAEFAVIVDPAWRSQGLARHLMERLFEWARSMGVREIVGTILAENRPMLGFVRALGFTLRRRPDDPEVIEARRAV